MRSKRIAPRTQQRLAAAGAALIAVALAIAGGVFFRAMATEPGASSWRLLLSDRITLGFVRLATASLALYAIVSVAALTVGGRWLKAISAGGFEADDPGIADARAEAAERTLIEALEQRDQVLRLLEEYLRG